MDIPGKCPMSVSWLSESPKKRGSGVAVKTFFSMPALWLLWEFWFFWLHFGCSDCSEHFGCSDNRLNPFDANRSSIIVGNGFKCSALICLIRFADKSKMSNCRSVEQFENCSVVCCCFCSDCSFRRESVKPQHLLLPSAASWFNETFKT